MNKAFEFLNGLHRDQKKYMAIGVMGFLLLTVYGVSKTNDINEKVVIQSTPSEFKNGRIVSDRPSEYYRNKDIRLMKQYNKIKSSHENLKAQLKKVQATLTKVEQSQKPTVEEKEGKLTQPLTLNSLEGWKSNDPTKEEQNGVSVAHQMGADEEKIDVGNTNQNKVGKSYFRASMGKAKKPIQKRPKIVRFPIKTKSNYSVVIPSGSYVKAKLMTGVQTPEGKVLPSLLALEQAYISPNRSQVNLSGCFALAKTQASMSTERVEFQVYKLSCVSSSGKIIERSMNGFVVDGKDQGFAIKGEIQSNQSRVAAMAFMESVVNGVGEIINRKSQKIGGANPDTDMVIRQGASGAASQVAQWYLQQANNLSATINVKSGQDVFIIMNEKVILPKSYFKKLKKKRRKSNEKMDFINHIIN